MNSRSTAAKIIIVHAWKVVMNERVCMDHLDRCRQAADISLPTHTFRRRKDKACTQPFSSGAHRVLHSLAELTTPDGFLSYEFRKDFLELWGKSV